jgi:hypothetical protein
MPLRTALLILTAAILGAPALLVLGLALLPPPAALLLGLLTYGAAQLVTRWWKGIALAALLALAWHIYRNRSTR